MRSAKEVPSAFSAYHAVRRPRAQNIVETSQEVGQMYTFTDPRYGSDLTAIFEDMRTRFSCIWEHDLEKDAEEAEILFRRTLDAQV